MSTAMDGTISSDSLRHIEEATYRRTMATMTTMTTAMATGDGNDGWSTAMATMTTGLCLLRRDAATPLGQEGLDGAGETRCE